MATTKNILIFLFAFFATIVVGVNAHATYTPITLTSAEQALISSGSYIAVDGMNVPVQQLSPFGRFNVGLAKTATTNLAAPLAVAEAAGARVAIKGLASTALKAVPYVGLGVTAYMIYADIKALSSPTVYPDLYNATMMFNWADATANNVVGDKINGHAYGSKQISTRTYSSYPSATAVCSSGTDYGSTQIFVYVPATSPTCNSQQITSCSSYSLPCMLSTAQVIYAVVATANPAPVPATDAQATVNLGGSSGLSTAQESQLVDMAKANPSKVGLPDAVAVSAAIQSQINAEQQQAASDSVAGLTDAKSKYDALCAANPGSSYCAEASRVGAELQDAKKKLLETGKIQAKESQDATANTMPTNTADTLKTFDWSAATQLKNAMANTFPFSLIGSMSNVFTGLVRDPVAPSFDLPIYGSTHLTCDLSIFDGLALVIRWLVGLIVTAGTMMGLVKFWRGVS